MTPFFNAITSCFSQCRTSIAACCEKPSPTAQEDAMHELGEVFIPAGRAKTATNGADKNALQAARAASAATAPIAIPHAGAVRAARLSSAVVPAPFAAPSGGASAAPLSLQPPSLGVPASGPGSSGTLPLYLLMQQSASVAPGTYLGDGGYYAGSMAPIGGLVGSLPA